MNEFYDQELASVYDYLYPDFGESYQIAEYLKTNSPGEKVIEFGIGTGRLAIPLVEQGLTVHGIDNSPEMLDVLRKKNNQPQLTSEIYDFGRDELPDQDFDACLLACNTICSFLDVQAQRMVFHNAAASIQDDGIFVIQTFNPLWLLNKGTEFTQMRSINSEMTLFEQYKIFPTRQEVEVLNTLIHHSGGAKFFTHRIRYMHPFEMDALAALAGFELQERTGDFSGSPYTSTSSQVVSTYLKVE